MADKPVPIDLVPYSDMLGDSREFLRVWAKEGGPVTCFINPVPVGGDPMGYGIALVDCIRHGAKTWARANPTDLPTEHPTTDEDGLIH